MRNEGVKAIVVGTIAFDSIRTPFGERPRILGGSALHASVAASFFEAPGIIGVVGKDFGEENIDFLQKRGIDTQGIQTLGGKTFHWAGFYEFDMNQAHTLETHLNVLAEFEPVIPPSYGNAEFVFLANIDPVLQLKVLESVRRPRFTAADTMNFWIEHKRETVMEVARKVDFLFINDAELRQLTGVASLPKAARALLKSGVKSVIVKKGEHGALFFSPHSLFAVPSYPVEDVIDPTGAGDSFAGGILGHLAKTGDLSEGNIRNAIIFGSVMASFNVEDFGCDRLRCLRWEEIMGRFEEFRKYTELERVSV